MIDAVDFIQHGPKHSDWMQWIPCSFIECRGFHALWRNGSRLYAVESMQQGPMHPDWMQMILCSMAQIIPIECSMIECSLFHAVWINGIPLNAVDLCSIIECSGFLQDDWMQWSLCSMTKSIQIECSGFHAPSLNAEDSMHCGAWIPTVCTGVHEARPNASRLNAVDSMRCGAVDSDWMHRGAVYHNWMQWIR